MIKNFLQSTGISHCALSASPAVSILVFTRRRLKVREVLCSQACWGGVTAMVTHHCGTPPGHCPCTCTGTVASAPLLHCSALATSHAAFALIQRNFLLHARRASKEQEKKQWHFVSSEIQQCFVLDLCLTENLGRAHHFCDSLKGMLNWHPLPPLRGLYADRVCLFSAFAFCCQFIF